MNYLFSSERLGFRNWTMDDLEVLAGMNADEEVMEHFPETKTREETTAFIGRLQEHYDKHGYTYFAVDLKENKELLGFVGLAWQTYETEFTPATDIGWRLKKTAWGKGYATEGAKRCLQYAFEDIKLDQVIAVCTVDNWKSANVMKKIGMKKIGEFKHPELKAFPDYERCFCYAIQKSEYGEWATNPVSG